MILGTLLIPLAETMIILYGHSVVQTLNCQESLAFHVHWKFSSHTSTDEIPLN